MASNSIGKEPECRDSVIDIPQAECCIYRVPKLLRNLNKDAYTPKLVSIGPFHYGEEELRDMEMHKPKYLEAFLDRTGRIREELLKIIKDNEDRIRRCYSETFDQKYCSEEFVNMILLDAIFIIELFLRFKEVEEAKEKGKEANDKKDYILSKPWLDNGICYDLILLENQLPFFVLEELHKFAFNIDSSSSNHHKEGKRIEDPFIMLARKYFKDYDKQGLMPISIGEEVKHFTDLIRYFFGTITDRKPEEYLDNQYCATDLDNAGLKFKADEKRRLLQIRFPENKCLNYFPCLNLSWLLACLPCFKFPCLERMQYILEVPTFVIYKSTEALFLNLMALEQCHYPFNAHICNYVMLLDSLIDTEKDVKLLVDEKVICNKIGSNEAVATLINNLSVQIPEGNSYYAVIGYKINKYSINPWNRIMASLKSTYFRDFWRGSTTMVGLIVLGFTLWGFLRLYV